MAADKTPGPGDQAPSDDSKKDRYPLMGDGVLVFQLARSVELRKKAEGNYHKLEIAIEKENLRVRGKLDPKIKTSVDRRKLSEIVEGKNVVLSLEELIALNCYLERYNLGLSSEPIFDKPDLIDILIERGDLIFFVGSRHTHKGAHIELSHFDVNSFAAILRRINQVSSNVNVELMPVLRQEERSSSERALADEKWVELLDDDGLSVVSIASPRANLATEAMLAKMFQTDPFDRGELSDPRLPCYFVWPEETHSCIALDPKDLAQVDADVARAVTEEGQRAFYYDGKLLAAEPPRLFPHKTYGVVFAQRRRKGQVWIVIAGLSGPATYATALALRTIPMSLPPADPQRHSAVIWAPIESQIELDHGYPGMEIPKVVSQQLLQSSEFWSP